MKNNPVTRASSRWPRLRRVGHDQGGAGLFSPSSPSLVLPCLFCIVYCLQIIIKGTAARILKQVVGFNPYLNIIVGMGITILVQSSSITTSTLTPIAAVGLISLEEMFPLTLGANIAPLSPRHGCHRRHL